MDFLGRSSAFGSPAPLFGAEEYDMSQHDNEIGGRQIRALLERNHAGHFGPVELDRFMKRPFGPILPETIESVLRVPDMITDPEEIRVLPDVGPVCGGYTGNREYLVSSVDHRQREPMNWFLWNEGVGLQENAFLGIKDGKTLWFGTMKSVGAGMDTYHLYLGHDRIEKKIEDFKEKFSIKCQIRPMVAFREPDWTKRLTDVDRVLLTQNGELYLWVVCIDAAGEVYRLLDFQRGLGTSINSPTVQLGMTHDGEVVATYVTENKRVFVNARTGKEFNFGMSARDRFVGFWVFNNGTHVIGMEGKSTDRVFAMHLSGQDSRCIPFVPEGQILGFQCIGNTPLPMTVWKVKTDESVYYTIGKTPQPARFDSVSELFQDRESGKWMYYGLLKATRHICRVELELPQK